MATNVAGWRGYLKIGKYIGQGVWMNHTILSITRWTLTWNTVDLDTTAFDDNGYRTLIKGKATADIRAEGFFDQDQQVHANGLIFPGTKVPEIILGIVSGNPGKEYATDTAMCINYETEVDEHGIVRWRASFKTDSIFFSDNANFPS